MDYGEITKLMGTRIRELREKRGWSQEVLAELSGLNRSYIGALERAEHNVGIRNIATVAKALEVEIAQLFKRKEQKKPEKQSNTPKARNTRKDEIPKVMINRSTFNVLLAQCASERHDLIEIFLERCGVVFYQN